MLEVKEVRLFGRAGVALLGAFLATAVALAEEARKLPTVELVAPSAAGATTLSVVGAEFGVFDDSNPSELVFTPSDTVPHREGQRYGWAIELRTSLRSVSVREEYLLPNPVLRPASPLGEGVIDVPFERHSQVSQRQLVPVDGMIYGEWSVGPHEPAGHRHLQVVVEGTVAGDFEFDVK